MFIYGGEHNYKDVGPELFQIEERKSYYVNSTPYYPLSYHSAIPSPGCEKEAYFNNTCLESVATMTAVLVLGLLSAIVYIGEFLFLINKKHNVTLSMFRLVQSGFVATKAY